MNITQSKMISLLILLLFLSHIALCQTASDSTNNISKLEIGIDLLGLTDKNNLPKSSIFFRRNYALSKNKCRAWRLRIGTDTERRKAKSWDNSLLGDYTTYSPYLSIGHEWKKLFPKYKWFIGSDLFGSFTHSNQYYLISDDLYYDDKTRDFDIGIAGIIGFQSNITKFLSISLESSFIVQYQKRYRYITGYLTQGGDNSRQINTFIKPIMAINLLYALQDHKKNVKN